MEFCCFCASNYIESRFVLIIFLDEKRVQVALLIDVQKDEPTSPRRDLRQRAQHRNIAKTGETWGRAIRLENKSAPKKYGMRGLCDDDDDDEIDGMLMRVGEIRILGSKFDTRRRKGKFMTQRKRKKRWNAAVSAGLTHPNGNLKDSKKPAKRRKTIARTKNVHLQTCDSALDDLDRPRMLVAITNRSLTSHNQCTSEPK
ncbi:hypothetical protein Y032_0623g770 [Ancylostoma ceylanicum]|uniref:Uncharacterized protein n=1 Tax=Ancylostoma ceylanicum TaxID=53326 RepID=A0A016WMI6_9BILA|nr:hypothetical protein Y032_0623g770 [Ancylostoma ceylanicum]